MNGLTPRHHPEAPEEAMAGGASRFLTAEDAGRLTQFYLGFDFEARHDRFGAEVSDHAIIDYCDAIEWRRSVLIARASAVVLEAALEIHPLSQQWDCAELIAACPSRGDRGDSLARLLQIAAFAAGQRHAARDPAAAAGHRSGTHCNDARLGRSWRLEGWLHPHGSRRAQGRAPHHDGK